MQKTSRILLSVVSLMLLLVICLVGPAVAYQTSFGTDMFVDIDGHWAEEAMNQLINMGVVNGYEKEEVNDTGETYLEYYIRPDKLITRAEFSTILAKALDLPVSTDSSVFTDTEGHWANGYINALYSHEIVRGYDGGLFKPEAKITRGEIVTMLVKALHNQDQVAETVYFSDIRSSADHWAFDSIQKAVSMDIVKGYPNGSFSPNGKAKRSEVMTMLVNFLNNDATEEGLPEDEDLLDIAAQYQRSVESVLKSTPDTGNGDNPLDWSAPYKYVTGGEKLALDGLAEVFNSLAIMGIDYSFDIRELTKGQVISKSDYTAVVKQFAKMNLRVETEEESLEGDVYTYLMKEDGKWLVYLNPEME